MDCYACITSKQKSVSTSVEIPKIDPKVAPAEQFVIVTDELDCYACDPKKPKSSTISSESISSIALYPNPASDRLSISVPLERNQEATVQLYDFSGKLVLENLISNETASIVSVAELNQGIYLYNVQIEGIAVKSGKLSIIH